MTVSKAIDVSKYPKMAEEICKILENENKKIDVFVPGIKVFLCGAYSPSENYEFLKRIEKKIRNESLINICTLKTALELMTTECKLTSQEQEQIMLEHAKIVVMIDSKNPGIVRESTLISNNIRFQEKTILFVRKDIYQYSIEKIDSHYLYFPRIISYEDEENLIEQIKIHLVRETRRLAYYYYHVDKKR